MLIFQKVVFLLRALVRSATRPSSSSVESKVNTFFSAAAQLVHETRHAIP